ncbi:MAG: UDP-N-acetylmuramate dehydrogenase, partial [Gammaproteobacteria bacterium]|nr:UDP-N-acetylmuramate dehydrogenase [Gammaproteobacteria bacterium]
MKQSLLQYNTFGVDSYTSKLSVINQRSDIYELINDKSFDPDNFLFIGAGSNLLLLDDVPDHVIAMRLSGIEYQKQSNGDVNVTVAAGVNWHELVQDTLEHGYSGLENLALIPGLVGAAPIQNIGAYGVEQCDKFISLTAINMKTGEEKTFYKNDCQFGYRDSVFKHAVGKYYLITSVSYLLNSKDDICIDYKVLSDAFIEETNVTAKMVFEKVCEIRSSKLPDPVKLGNAGSFFKNPVVSNDKYTQIKAQFPDLIAYSQPDNKWKLAAGWMIQKAELKGYRKDNVGVHVDQALVLVNY